MDLDFNLLSSDETAEGFRFSRLNAREGTEDIFLRAHKNRPTSYLQ